MRTRNFARALVAALMAVMVLAPTLPAAAAPTQDQQVEVTLKRILTDALRASGGTSVSPEVLTSTIDGYDSKSAWERNVDFTSQEKHSLEYGVLSVAYGEDGTVGIATRTFSGGCSLTTIVDGEVVTWTFEDLGKNCNGSMALRGPNAPSPGWLDPVPPVAPAGLTATAGDTVVALTWSASPDADVTRYEIVQDGVVVGQVPAGTLTYTVTGLKNYTTYTFTVQAVDAAENASDASNSVEATPVDLTPPPVPTDVKATPGSSSATLSWSPVTADDLAGYKVHLDGVLVGETTSTTFTFTNLVAGQSYTLTVASYDVNGNVSAHSAPVALTLTSGNAADSVPQNLVATVTAPTDVTLTWDAVVAPDLAYYRIYQDGAVVWHTTSTRIVRTPLVPGATYTFTVSTVDKTGKAGKQSQAVTVTLPEQDSGTWAKLGGLGYVASASAIDAQGKVYVMGGMSGKSIYNGAQVFDPATNKWKVLPPMLYARANFTAMVDDQGRVYAFGGKRYYDLCSVPGCPTNPYAYYRVYNQVSERYDPVTNKWEVIPGMVSAHAWHTSAKDSEGRMYVIGGKYDNYTTDGYTKVVERFDPRTDQWARVADLPQPTAQHATTVDKQGRIYLLGGCHGGWWPCADSAAWRYDPSTGSWSILPSMTGSRRDFSAAVDGEGRVYAFGGFGGYTGIHLMTAERFDPATGTWTQLPNMLDARSSTLAVTDSDGRIIVAGGFGYGYQEQKFKNLVERFDPATGTWTRLPNSLVRRSGPAGHYNPVDGQVYLVGGGTYAPTGINNPAYGVERFKP